MPLRLQGGAATHKGRFPALFHSWLLFVQDFKPLNAVRVGERWKLIDMDAAAAVDGHDGEDKPSFVGLKCAATSTVSSLCGAALSGEPCVWQDSHRCVSFWQPLPRLSTGIPLPTAHRKCSKRRAHDSHAHAIRFTFGV